MPAVASITIVVDDKGAVRALNNVTGATEKMSPAFQKAGSMGNLLTTSLVRNHEKARDAVQLLANTTGIQVPRALEKIIAKAPVVSAALVSAFETVAIVAFVAQIGRLISDLDAAKVAFSQWNESGLIAVGHIREFLGLQANASLEMQRFLKQRELFLPLIETERKLQQQATSATLQGFAAIEEKRKQGRDDILQTETAQLLSAKNVFGATAQYERAKINITQAADHAMVAADGVAAAERIALARQIHDQTRQLQNQATLSALTGLDQIREKENQAVAEQEILLNRSLITRAAFDARKVAIEQDAENQIIKMQHDAAAQGQQAILQAEAAGLAGQAQLDAQRLAELQSISMKEQEQHIELTNERLAIDLQYKNKSLELARQHAEEVKQLETDAAIAMLPPWERAGAQMAADLEKRLREIQEEMRRTGMSSEEAAHLSALAWQKYYAEARDKLAGDLESLFDDITSGNIGKRFLNQFKHMVFQMIATWLLGMQQMRSASQGAMGGGGGGILGAIFGSLGLGGIFGGGGQAGPGVPSTGPGGTPPFIGNLLQGGGGGGDVPFASGGDLQNLGMLSPTPTFSAGTGLSAGMGAGALGTILPAGAGPGGDTGEGGPLGGLLAKLFPHGVTIGGTKISGQALATVGLALLTSSFRKGGILGGLGGAAGGALTGFAIAGPIGAVIGAIAGFITGIWGHSTKKARLEIEAQVKAQSQKIEDEFKFYQIDFSTARDQLEQVRQQGVDALRQAGVKDISRSRVGHVDHWVDKAITDINTIEAERVRREQLTFGPPEFRTGGFVGSSLAASAGQMAAFRASAGAGLMHFAGGGAVPAILHTGEFVMRSEAVQRVGRGNLERMNSGGVSRGDTHVHIHAADPKSFAEWLRDGGLKVILTETARAESEGWA